MFEEEKKAIENLEKIQGISARQYTSLISIYNSMNTEFFNGELPDVILMLDYSRETVAGFFQHERFTEKGSGNKKSVISLNPDIFKEKEEERSCSTFLHEMCHCWEYYCTQTRPKGGYHDSVWSKKMEELGLKPVFLNSHRTKVTHEVVPEGHFTTWFQGLQEKEGIFILLADLQLKSAFEHKGKYTKKTKYVCPGCNSVVWGRPGLQVTCGDCGEAFEEEIK